MKKTDKIKGYGPQAAGAFAVAFELGFAIALPLVGFALLGKWLDQRHGTGFFVYLGIALAIITSSVWVYRRFSEMIDTLVESAQQNEKDKDENNK